MLFSKAALAAAAVTFMVFVDAKDVTCKKGKMTTEVTLNEGDTFSFRSIRGAVYAGRQRCRVNYKLGSCTAASVSCSKFDLKADKICRTGDSITINSRGSEPRKFCRSKGPMDVSFKEPFSVFFKSNKWKGGAFKCEVSCTAGPPPPPIKIGSVELHWALASDFDLHVYAYNETATDWSGNCDCSKDTDHTNPPGPEIITWTGSATRYLIWSYGYRYTFFPMNSGAELRVIGSDDSETIFSAPMDEAGKYWILGCFDGDLGLNSLNALNILTNSAYTLDCTPLGLDTITLPSMTDNLVIDQLAADEASKALRRKNEEN